jgi:hypothetical protein
MSALELAGAIDIALRPSDTNGNVGASKRADPEGSVGDDGSVADLKSARVDNQSVKQLLVVTSLAEREQILKGLDAGGLSRAARAVEQHRMRAMQQLQRTT